MSGTRGYFQYFTLLLLLALCSIQQVSSIKCYMCSSDKDPDCISDANQSKFAVDCSAKDSFDHSFSRNLGIQEYQRQEIEFDCGYVRGVSTIDKGTRVERGCAVKTITCDMYKKIYKANYNIEVEKCERCEKDLCNSSENLNAGIWSLSLSLIAIYFFKI